jgi:hypothetical protein
MGFNIGNLFATIIKTAGDITGIGILKEAGKALESADLPPEKKLELEKQLQDFTLVAFQKEIDDRANARGREIALAQVGAKDSTTKVLAYVVVASALIMESCIVIFGYPQTIPGEVVGRILGTFDSAALLVLGYYFGSSIGSKQKQDTIDTLSGK